MLITEVNLKKRFGESGDETNTPCTFMALDQSHPTPYVYFNTSFNTGYYYNTYTGWDIPNFHRRSRRGELLPHTPWYRFDARGEGQGVYDITTQNGSNWLRVWAADNIVDLDQWRLSLGDLQSYAPDMSDRYVQDAAAAIYSEGWDALTFLAEFTQLKGLFLNTAETLLKLRIPKNWKQLSNEWLSLRYGWRPLLSDIESINNVLTSLREKERTRYSNKKGYINLSSERTYGTVTKSEYDHDYQVNDSIEVGLRGSVTADIVVPLIQVNPLITAWEIVPLSFVLDWFLSVGRALSAASFLSLQTKYAASKGYWVKVTRTLQSEIGATRNYFKSGTHEIVAQSNGELEVRTPCRVSKTPQFTLRLDSFKILDLMGLVFQRLNRRN